MAASRETMAVPESDRLGEKGEITVMVHREGLHTVFALPFSHLDYPG
jgi:hypothetical protein